MMYNMYDVVLLPTSWCWRRYKGHSCINDDRTSSIQAHQVCVLATQLKLLYLPHTLTRCGSTKHLHYYYYL